MEKMGISASTAINMFYRQIIYSNGMPFRPRIPTPAPKAYDEMTKAEFDAAMEESIAQSEAGQAVPFDEAFERIIANRTKKLYELNFIKVSHRLSLTDSGRNSR